jgi:hypothetical protein
MPSTIKTKCPVCGVEDGLCVGGQPGREFHVERLRLANPTTYEHPDCEECRKLKDDLVREEYSVRGFRPEGAYRPRSRWPKDYREEMSRLERATNLARAKYELHLFGDHKDKSYEGRAITNLEVVMREGRLKP